MIRSRATLLAAASAVLVAAALGTESPAAPAAREVLFGDLHLHTSMSFDAAAAGTTTMPEDSYRFALGAPVQYFGRTVQRRAPLDFLAVTDHSEYLGIVSQAADPAGPFAGTKWPALITRLLDKFQQLLAIFSPGGFRGEPPIPEFVTPELIRTNWQREIDAAQRYYRPGKFTTLVAYEWSPMPGGAHMHRNVIFRGPRYPEVPFSAVDSMKPEDLWRYAEGNRVRGIDSVLIPHNSNLSEGLMFAFRDSAGNEMTREYAQRRMENERLVEISQNKGSSETRPEFAPNDEFAGYELVNWAARGEAKSVDLRGGYVREAYKRGLQIQARTGGNPFKMGIVGGSDFHSGLSSAEEANFPGGLGASDAQSDPARVLTQVNPLMRSATTVLSASGLTGVWATRNDRESIFDALKRREVFGTSGNRIRLRMFAGWRYAKGLTGKSDWVSRAYAGGVAMGGDLAAPCGTRLVAPVLLLQAVKDPNTGNLDRMQVVKVWMQDGQPRERIYDALWSGKRRPGADGRLPPVGNSVDLKTATFTNDIGAAELKGEWRDPDFDARHAAIYYVRVLEVPTPRWSTYLAVRNNLPLSKDVPPTIQERAWSSPVFYTPTVGNRSCAAS